MSTNDSWSDDFSFVDTKTSRMPFKGVTMLKKPKINHKRGFVLRIRHGVGKNLRKILVKIGKIEGKSL